MANKCTLLTPALPSELLAYILKQHHTGQTTTLVICSRRADFVNSILHEVLAHDGDDEEQLTRLDEPSAPVPDAAPAADVLHNKYPHLVTSPLHQLVTSRHIRTLYMPTVTHLRSYFSVAGVASSTSKSASAGITSSSKVPVPPSDDETVAAGGVTKSGSSTADAFIVMYGFLELHRDTSEWSAQGLSHSCSTLVEYAHHQLGLRGEGEVLLVEPAWRAGDGGVADTMPAEEDGDDHHDVDYGDIVGGVEQDDHPQGVDDFATSSPHRRPTPNSKRGARRKRIALEDLLTEHVPLLTGGGSTLRKLGIDGDEPGWAGRTVEVGRVLKRWMRFRQADWNQAS